MPTRARTGPRVPWGNYLGFVPAALIVVFVYLFAMGWTVWMSFTNSKMLPANKFVGTFQYARLFGDDRWQVSVVNLGIFCGLFVALSLILGLLMAIALDQKVRFEDGLRTIYLYPQGMSFIVTGLIWQWILNPQMGLQAFFRGLGLEGVRIDCVRRRMIWNSRLILERRLGLIGFRLCHLTLVVQAAVLDGLLFDAPPFSQDGFTATEVDVSRG
jgi:ABC-type sugar transport system permease subunit